MAEDFERQVKTALSRGKALSPSVVEGVVKLAMDNIALDAQLVSTLYRGHKKAQNHAKIYSLYLIDAVAREARSRAKKLAKGKDKDSSTPSTTPPPPDGESGTYSSFLKKLEALLSKVVIDCWENGPKEHREKARKVLDIWIKAGTFNSSILTRITSKLEASTAGADAKPSEGGDNSQAVESPVGPAQADHARHGHTTSSSARSESFVTLALGRQQASVIAAMRSHVHPVSESYQSPELVNGLPASVAALLAASKQPTQEELDKVKREQEIEKAVRIARGEQAPSPPPIAPPPSNPLTLDPAQLAMLQRIAAGSSTPIITPPPPPPQQSQQPQDPHFYQQSPERANGYVGRGWNANESMPRQDWSRGNRDGYNDSPHRDRKRRWESGGHHEGGGDSYGQRRPPPPRRPSPPPPPPVKTEDPTVDEFGRVRRTEDVQSSSQGPERASSQAQQTLPAPPPQQQQQQPITPSFQPPGHSQSFNQQLPQQQQQQHPQGPRPSPVFSPQYPFDPTAFDPVSVEGWRAFTPALLAWNGGQTLPSMESVISWVMMSLQARMMMMQQQQQMSAMTPQVGGQGMMGEGQAGLMSSSGQGEQASQYTFDGGDGQQWQGQESAGYHGGAGSASQQ